MERVADTNIKSISIPCDVDLILCDPGEYIMNHLPKLYCSKCDNEANYVENLIPKCKEHIDRMAVKIKDFINISAELLQSSTNGCIKGMIILSLLQDMKKFNKDVKSLSEILEGVKLDYFAISTYLEGFELSKFKPLNEYLESIIKRCKIFDNFILPIFQKYLLINENSDVNLDIRKLEKEEVPFSQIVIAENQINILTNLFKTKIERYNKKVINFQVEIIYEDQEENIEIQREEKQEINNEIREEAKIAEKRPMPKKEKEESNNNLINLTNILMISIVSLLLFIAYEIGTVSSILLHRKY